MNVCNSAKRSFDPSLSQSPLILESYQNGPFSHWGKEILRQIIRDCAKFKTAYPTNEQLAARVGCSPKTVQRFINQAHKMGILYRTTWQVHKTKRARRIAIKWRALRRLLGIKTPIKKRVRKKMNKCPYTTPTELLGDGFARLPQKTKPSSADPWGSTAEILQQFNF